MHTIMMMLVYLYKCQSLTLVTKHLTFRNICSTPPIIGCYRTKTIIPTNVDSSDFKISFLKNKCGLSGISLIRVCKCVDFNSSDQTPVFVVDLFQSFGFPKPNLAKIISTYPHILINYHSRTILKPKLDFLLSISQSQADVVAIITKNPILLIRSLDNHLIPSLNVLNSVTGSYPKIVSVLRYNPYIISHDLPNTLLLNTQFLSTLGVPHSHILKLLRSYGVVLGTAHGKFCNFVLKLTDMGFDLKSSYFFHAIHVLCFVSDSTWESRWELFRSFSFSNSEIFSMFKKLPLVMCYTDKSIKLKMEFFLKKLRWTLFRLSTYPAVLSYSLEKRIIPRCSVLQVLVLKNVTSESYNLLSILVKTDKIFFEDFVTAYKDEVPEVIEAYQGKLRFDVYTFKQTGQLSLTQL